MHDANIDNFDNCSFDARVWAKEFCRLFPGHDEGLMISWFANAIMAGYDYAVNKIKDEIKNL